IFQPIIYYMCTFCSVFSFPTRRYSDLIRTVHARFERRRERAERAAVPHDDDLAVVGLPKVARVDLGRRRKILIVGAAHQHLAADATPELPARDRDDDAVPPLALADALASPERHVL